VEGRAGKKKVGEGKGEGRREKGRRKKGGKGGEKKGESGPPQGFSEMTPLSS